MKQTLCALGLAALALQAPAADPRQLVTDAATGAVTMQVDGKACWTYVPQSAEGKPYFHPLAIPGTGEALTAFRPPDHRWHLGLWFSWKYITGCNFWEPDTNGVTRVVSQTVRPADDQALDIAATIAYSVRGREAVRETRAVRVVTQTNGNYTIAWDSTFVAQGTAVLDQSSSGGSRPARPAGARILPPVAPAYAQALRRGKQGHGEAQPSLTQYDSGVVFSCTPARKDKAGHWASGGYAGLMWRFADSTAFDYTFTNAAGQADVEICGARSAWVTVLATSKKSGARAKITFRDHPENPRFPTPWFARYSRSAQGGRGYNLVGPAMIFHEPLKLASGASARFRYTVSVERL